MRVSENISVLSNVQRKQFDTRYSFDTRGISISRSFHPKQYPWKHTLKPFRSFAKTRKHTSSNRFDDENGRECKIAPLETGANWLEWFYDFSIFFIEFVLYWVAFIILTHASPSLIGVCSKSFWPLEVNVGEAKRQRCEHVLSQVYHTWIQNKQWQSTWLIANSFEYWLNGKWYNF